MPSEGLLGAGFWSAASRAAQPILSARTSRFGDLSPSGEGTRVAPGLCCQAFIEKLLKASERALCSLGVSIMRQVAAVDNLDPEFVEVISVAANGSSGARRVPRPTESMTKLGLYERRERRVPPKVLDLRRAATSAAI
jgi:hypothetical protein